MAEDVFLLIGSKQSKLTSKEDGLAGNKYLIWLRQINLQRELTALYAIST